ncbi:MAG: M48 family metallopeptidase [Spirosomataceae bacterium]
MNRSRLIIALVMAAIALFTYYSNTQVNPVTGEKQHIAITPEQEIALGLQSAPQMANEFGGLYPDQKVQQYVKQVGQKLVASTEAHNSSYQFDFHVLADPETINAFALPGGQIFITVGLLKRLQTEDQLAGVLGHEIGHVVARHSAQQMAKEQLTNGLVNAAVVASQDPNNPSNSGAIAQYVAKVVSLKYGREDELEADRFGIKYMPQAGYQPTAMIDVLEILQQAMQGERPPEMMSTHPYPENRIAQIQEILAQQAKK